ncbi:MAG: hypothetical protein ABGX12_05630 [Desulfurobacteriaceae bacterium]
MEDIKGYIKVENNSEAVEWKVRNKKIARYGLLVFSRARAVDSRVIEPIKVLWLLLRII